MSAAPWSPKPEGLSKEFAVVVQTTRQPGRLSNIEYRTDTGRSLLFECSHQGKSRCVNVVHHASMAGTEVWLWHDGERIYRVQQGEITLMDYRDGREFTLAMAAICALVVGLRLAVHLGLISVPVRDLRTP